MDGFKKDDVHCCLITVSPSVLASGLKVPENEVESDGEHITRLELSCDFVRLPGLMGTLIQV